MEKFLPTEKMSKNQRKMLNAANRKTWGAISPITRKSENKKVYDRKKNRRNGSDNSDPCGFIMSARNER